MESLDNTPNILIAWTIFFAKCTLNCRLVCLFSFYLYLLHLQYTFALLHFSVNKVVYI